MPSSAASSAWLRKALRRFRRNGQGSAIVEFALVAPMFFALLFAIIETGIFFFAGQYLESVTQDSARMILTGQAQAKAYATVSDFKLGVVCPRIIALFDCTNGIFVDVQSYPAFSNITINSQIDNSNNFISNNLGYNPGGQGQIVVVRLFYQWPLFVTGLGYNIANLSGSKRLLAATAAFQNEPSWGP